jgi:hypothetical protein
LKNYLLILVFAVLCSTQITGQYYSYFEWGQDEYKKKQYHKAEKYLYKAIENSAQPDIKAASWLYLMDIYKNGMINDSLYFACKKSLVKTGYESPNYRITYVDIDPNIYIPEIPEIDLYHISRELVCELYEKGEYDSALFYFNNYASKTYEKGWCGVGKENNFLFDQIMLARLSAAIGDTILAFEWLDLTPYIDPYDETNDHFFEIFCFYDNVRTLYPGYHKGDILKELDESLHYGRIKDTEVHFCTCFRGRSIYFHEKWIPRKLETKNDTINAMDSVFHQTLLYRMIEFKDKLQYDSVVTLQGYLSFGTGYVTFYSNGIAFDVIGMDISERPKGDIELTGKFIDEENILNSSRSYNRNILDPELHKKRTIGIMSYKVLDK